MQEITKKLHKQAMDEFFPIAEQLALEGASKNEIVNVFKKQIAIKTRHLHQRDEALKPMKEVVTASFMKMLEVRPDSHTEYVFYNMLVDKKVKFEFQHKIGPYRADFLFGGFLVVEIDGPQHGKVHDNTRDLYMRRLGYKIIRIPTWILAMTPEACVDEILDQLPKAKVLKFKKKRENENAQSV